MLLLSGAKIISNGKGKRDESERMRLIDADALIKYIREEIPLKYFMGHGIFEANKNLFHIKNEIRIQPTIDAVPVKHGHWIGVYTEHNSHSVNCSVCHGSLPYVVLPGARIQYIFETDYCPKCGAKMDLEEIQK